MWLAFFNWKNDAILKFTVEEVRERIAAEMAADHALLVFHTKKSLIKAYRKSFDKVIEDIKKEESIKL